MASDHDGSPQHTAPTTSSPPAVKTPQATPGSAVVRVLAAGVIPYMRGIYNGTRKYGTNNGYAFPTPLVIGNGAMARVAAIGPDSTKVAPGQLVLVDTNIRSRDDPRVPSS